VINESPAGAIIEIRVIPRARNTTVAGRRNGALLVRLAAPPVAGAANAALISLFAELLSVPARTIQIVSGERTRLKRILIAGLRADVVRAKLGLG
jgi:uncharacterized protein (TIGR00251 family)